MNAKERIDQLRLKKGWSLNRLAQEMGVSDTTVYSWFSKKNFSPSAKTIQTACEVFGITLTEFYSCVDADNLEINETMLIESFRKLPKEEQDKVLKIIKIFEEATANK